MEEVNPPLGSPIPLPHSCWWVGEVLRFMVPKAHQVAAMNGCHWDAAHQGQQWTLCLLQDWFWWPGMAAQMQKAISNCEQCIQHEGTHAKAPMQPIFVTAPLELLLTDFTSIEMMMEFNQPPNIVNILVFHNHFTKHVMVYMTLDQTVKPVAKFLWQCYISSFGAPVKLLSDWWANFESHIMKELCELMGIRKVRTFAYHAQTNGQVEWAHQMLMYMIGKLGRDQKADWLKHLPELVYTYNSMRSAVTRYSPHYLMFRHWPCLPINFYFPMVRSTRNTSMLITMSLSYMNDCVKPSRRLKCSPCQRQRDRSSIVIGKLMPFHWHQVTWSSLKPMPTRGRKVKDRWEKDPYKVEDQVTEGVPSYLVKN